MKQNTLFVKIFILSLQVMDLFSWIDSSIHSMYGRSLLLGSQGHNGMWASLPPPCKLYMGVVGLALCKTANCKLPECFYLSQSQLSHNSIYLNLATIHVHRPYLPSHYMTVTQFQYILIISIAWEFATN